MFHMLSSLYSNVFLAGDSRYISSHSSFLFSLYNPDGTLPVRMDVVDDQNETALYTNIATGPTFGNNYDLKIGSYDASTCCSSNLGQSYKTPPGYTPGTDKAKYFFTSTEHFSIDKLEVFYAYGKIMMLYVT